MANVNSETTIILTLDEKELLEKARWMAMIKIMDGKKKISIEDLEKALHKADLLLRPYIVFVNPKDKETLLSMMPDVEKSIVLEATDALEQGKAIKMKRETLENWFKGII